MKKAAILIAKRSERRWTMQWSAIPSECRERKVETSPLGATKEAKPPGSRACPGVVIPFISVVCILVFVLVGCAEGYRNPKSKELVIVNASDSGIISIGLSAYIEEGDMRVTTPPIIPPGAEKSFYLPPYADAIRLGIETESGGYGSILFTFDYKVDGRNETITATYTEIYVPGAYAYYDGNIELEGSNSALVPK
ncbi:MAG: hypothetical protein AB7S52_11770 [Sphaerochaetaceae bacterium]